MTRKTLMLTAIVITCICTAALALPTIKITTSNGNEPPAGKLASGSVGNSPAFNFEYASMSKFELTGTGNPNFDVSRNTPRDSIRQRGNSTANVDMPKKPYRIKFDQKVSLFGKPAAKSWVLLANHMDKTFAMNALAFRLGQIIGLEFTPSFQFVNLEICNPNGTCTYKGIYQLTEQVQVNPGRVDIDENKGWLVEFNFHNPDANDIMFTTGNSRYNLSVFVKSPEIDDKDYTGSSWERASGAIRYPQIAFVRDEFYAIMDTLASTSRFAAGAHRDMIDLTSYAKYVFIQQFTANFEWAQLGYVGSNFAYKNIGDRMKAGPIWDFDLATGTLNNASHYTFFSSSSSQLNIDPTASSTQRSSSRNAFYRRLFDDQVFRARYRKIWEDNKAQIQALAANGGFIDSVATLLRDHIAANYEPYKDFRASSTFGNNCFVGCGVTGSGPSSASAYDQEITKLKTWWNNRYTYWNTNISSGSNNTRFDASKDIPDNPLPAMHAIKVGRTPNIGGTVTLKIANESTITNPDGNNYAVEGTTVTITSQTASGYRFTGWTAASGSLPASSDFDASRESNTFTLSGDIDIKANYQFGTSINDAAHGRFANGSRIIAARNGVHLNVVDKATVKIYGIDGKELRNVNMTVGSHHLRLGDMPKGIYMVRVQIDGKTQTLRVPVK